MRVDLVSLPQHESLIELLRELHAYYNEGYSVPTEMVRSHLMNNLLGPDSPLRLVVAYGDLGQVFGFAAISLTYSLVDPTPDQRRHCQLKELYVRSSQRSRGVGKAIMSGLHNTQMRTAVVALIGQSRQQMRKAFLSTKG